MKKLLGALCLFFFCVTVVTSSFAANKPAAQVESTATPIDLGAYHAILIGINDYHSFPKLKTPIKDVEDLAGILKNQYGFTDVVTLTDKTEDKPTTENILKYIREKAQSLTEKDNLLIYYAGHGGNDTLTDAGYWVPINGESKNMASMIPHSQITQLLASNKIIVKNFMLVADSCYSGEMISRSVKVYPDTKMDVALIRKRLLETKKSREVITSGGNAPVEDKAPGSDHSLFAHYFLEALKKNENRYIDMQTLFHKNVLPEIKKKDKQQTPQIARIPTTVDQDGLFILIKSGIAESLPPDPNVRIKELLAKIAELEKEIKELKDKQKKAEKELELVTESREKLRKDNASLQKEIASLQEQQKKVEVELKQVTNSR